MKGTYLLLIKQKTDENILVGKLGKNEFKKGYYVYVGSALNELKHRIGRHIRKQKKIHWHIDYLLQHAEIVKVFYKKNKIKEECVIARKLGSQLSSIPGFGCSDCQCKSHLFCGSYNKIIKEINNLHMKQYFVDKKS